MQEAYGHVIDLIDQDAIDYRAIGIALAKANPKAFLAIHNHVKNPQSSKAVEMNRHIVSLYQVGDKVPAIKHCREVTGWGLKEAKDYCDALAAGQQPPMPALPWTPATVAPMSELTKRLAELLGDDGAAPTAEKYRDGGTF